MKWPISQTDTFHVPGPAEAQETAPGLKVKLNIKLFLSLQVPETQPNDKKMKRAYPPQTKKTRMNMSVNK